MIVALAFALLQPAPVPLPAAWHGTWAGTLALGTGPGAKTVPMTLTVEPLPGGRRTWAMVYDAAGPRRVEKRYEIVPGKGPHDYEIDEKTGVRILARLSGDGKTLTSLFKVGDQLLHTTYTLAGDAVRFDLTAFGTADALDTAAGATTVTSYRLAAAQSAELKRVKK